MIKFVKQLQYNSRFKISNILGEPEYMKRKTKIVCTLGPASWSYEKILQLIDAGMNIARLNFSHGNHETHFKTVQNIRKAMLQRPNRHIAILMDAKGPSIRTGFIKNSNKLVNLKQGQDLIISTEDYENFLGDENKITCSYKSLPKSVKLGGQILIADGAVGAIVTEIGNKEIKVKIQNNAVIGEKKNMNLPGCQVDLPTITPKDEDDFVNFAAKHNIDLIGLSFARTAADILKAKQILGEQGKTIRILAKIENQDGIRNFDDILKVADGIMIARGDLGMEIPTQKVFVAQKEMIKRANKIGKPIVTCTQMMESMVKNPKPTRAEASDVANSVLDGTDAVMLSGETANGSFPIECVKCMSQICREAEGFVDYEKGFWNNIKYDYKAKMDTVDSMAISAVGVSFQINAPVIICLTRSGFTASKVEKYKPSSHIIAVSDQESALKALAVRRGVHCLLVPGFEDVPRVAVIAMQEAVRLGFAKPGDSAVILMGRIDNHPEGRDCIKVREIPCLPEGH